ASTNPKFNSGSSVIASYTVPNIPGIEQTSSGTPVFGDVNLAPPKNIATIIGVPVTLPVAPRSYFIGVVVDPSHNIMQLQQIGGTTQQSNGLSQVKHVGPPIPGLTPAGVVYPGGGANNLPFPYPPNVILSGITSTPPVHG